jgi:hypothetical protein
MFTATTLCSLTHSQSHSTNTITELTSFGSVFRKPSTAGCLDLSLKGMYKLTTQPRISSTMAEMQGHQFAHYLILSNLSLTRLWELSHFIQLSIATIIPHASRPSICYPAGQLLGISLQLSRFHVEHPHHTPTHTCIPGPTSLAMAGTRYVANC